MKKCPFCAEDIQDAAIKCRHCGSLLEERVAAIATSAVRRYQSITESDARLLPEGTAIEIAADCRITPRIEQLLGEKHVTVRRLAPAATAPRVGGDVERTVYETGLHWAVFLRPCAWLVLSFFLMNLPGLAGFFVVVAFIDFAGRALMRSNTHFKVTTRRLSLTTGTLRKRSLELVLPKVESIVVNESLVGRMFGYGSVAIGGTGGTKEVFPLVPVPQEFRRHVQEQLAAAQIRA